MSGLADARREARGVRVSLAVALMAIATVLTAAGLTAGLATGRPALVAAAAVLTVVLAWVSLRLTWNALVLARFQHAVERTELARTYRGLFAERAVEHAAYATSMGTRLAWSRRHVDDLRETLSQVGLRAVEAEATAREAQGRINRYDDQVAAMGRLLEHGPGPDVGPSGVPALVDTWDRVVLEADPIASLMAWEERVGRVRSGRPGRGAGSRPPLHGRHSVG